MRATMADHWVRLGMAIVVIALISFGLHIFGARASVTETLPTAAVTPQR